MTRFENEFRKIIAAEIIRLRDELVAGMSVRDYAQYQNYVGKLASLVRVIDEFIDEATKKANEG